MGNTRDEALVRSVLREHKLEAVIHFAAYKAAGESVANPGKYFDNNVYGTLQLLEAMRAGGREAASSSPRPRRSTATPQVLPVVETAALRPENPYGESKLMVEQMLPWYDAAFGLRSVALRYFNAAGAVLDGSIGEDPRYAAEPDPAGDEGRHRALARHQGVRHRLPHPRRHLHPRLHPRAGSGRRPPGGARLPGRRRTSSDIFNLGTGKGASVQGGADRRPPGQPACDIPTECVGRRAGDPVSVFADNTKARTVLGWTPRYGLEEIVASAWKWQSGHPDGWKTV